jgi:membrane fusion protein (multidrug efflux system)
MNAPDPNASAIQAPPARKRGALLAASAIAALALAAYGYHWFTEARFHESTDDAYVGADIVVLRPKVPGYIVEERVIDNQPVRKGDLLVRLDDRDYRAAAAKARAAVAAARALLVNLDATGRQQQAVIDGARAGVAATDAESLRARDDRQRYHSLVAKSAVSLQSTQRADADYLQAQAGGQKARAALVAAQRELDVIASRRQQAEAALAQAQAELGLAQLDLVYTEVRAPVDGVVGNRRARAGAYAQTGEQLLAIVPARGLWVDANFKEDQLARVQPGQRVDVAADVWPGRVFHGRVQDLAPATGAQFSVLPPENATGNFTKIVQRVPVRILLDPADGALGRLRPGLSVTAVIDTRGGDGDGGNAAGGGRVAVNQP